MKPFYKQYLTIFLPVTLQGLVTTFVGMIDNLMVGQLGEQIIAAVSFSSRILSLLMFTIFGIVGATGVFVAQYYGAKNKEKQQEVFRFSLVLSFSIYLFFIFIYSLFHRQILHFFIGNTAIEQIATRYLFWMIFAFLPFTLSINFSSTLKVLGQVRIPLFASVFAVGVNTVFNYLLIFGKFVLPELGVEGAAIATILSRIVEFLILYAFVTRKKFDFFRPIYKFVPLTKQTCLQVFRKALPLATNEVIWALGMATILKMYGTRGSEVVAAFAIADATAMIFFSTSQGAAAATPVFISQLLGANRFEEAFHHAKLMLKMILFVSAIVGIGMFTASFIVPNFYQVSPYSHALAKQMIQIMACMFWVYLTTIQGYYILRAGGDMKSTFLMDAGYMWAVTIPVMSIVVYYTSASIVMIYLASQCCDLLKLVISQYFFHKKKWIRNMTIHTT